MFVIYVYKLGRRVITKDGHQTSLLHSTLTLLRHFRQISVGRAAATGNIKNGKEKNPSLRKIDPQNLHPSFHILPTGGNISQYLILSDRDTLIR